jgi:hypothetical protein
VEFAAIAQYYLSEQHSALHSASSGWIGPVSLSTLPIEIVNLFRTQQVGIVSEPIPVADSFWVVRLEQFIAARLTETTRQHLINRLFAQWIQTQTHQVMNTPGAIAVQEMAVLNQG